MGLVGAEGASIVTSCGNFFWLGLTSTLDAVGGIARGWICLNDVRLPVPAALALWFGVPALTAFVS